VPARRAAGTNGANDCRDSSAYLEFTSAADDFARCSITTGTSLDFSHASTASDSATSNNRAPYAATRAFTVPADGFTVNLVCDMFSGTATLADSSLTAIFVGQ